MCIRDSNRGCSLGVRCKLYHPKHCKSSVQHKQCFKEKCTLVHIVGTKRIKRPIRQEKGGQRETYRRTNTPLAPENLSSKKANDSQHPSSSFLELQNLLKVMQADFRSELTSLKQQIVDQETKICSLFPTANQMHHPQILPHHLPAGQVPHAQMLQPLAAMQHLNPAQVPQWTRFHQHSC